MAADRREGEDFEVVTEAVGAAADKVIALSGYLSRTAAENGPAYMEAFRWLSADVELLAADGVHPTVGRSVALPRAIASGT